MGGPKFGNKGGDDGWKIIAGDGPCEEMVACEWDLFPMSVEWSMDTTSLAGSIRDPEHDAEVEKYKAMSEEERLQQTMQRSLDCAREDAGRHAREEAEIQRAIERS